MNEEKAKKHLRKMLRSFTPGTILHLLADIHRASAAKSGDERLKRVEETLFVVGLGIDAALPQ